MRVNIAALSVALLAAMPITAPTAHADDQAFLRDLESQGVVIQHAAELEVGYHACQDMHGGASFEAAANTTWWPTLVKDGTLRRIVEAAQRHLCPDTMR